MTDCHKSTFASSAQFRRNFKILRRTVMFTRPYSTIKFKYADGHVDAKMSANGRTTAATSLAFLVRDPNTMKDAKYVVFTRLSDIDTRGGVEVTINF